MVGDEVSAERVVEGLGPVERLLEGPHLFVSMLSVCPEVLGELKVDRFAYLCVEEGAEDVEAMQDHAFLGGEGKD